MPLWKLDNAIHAGKIIKQHGYLGNIRVAFSFPIDQEKLKAGAYMYLEWNEKPVPYLVETIQWTDESAAIVKLTDINTEEKVLALGKRNIILPQDYLLESEDEEDEDSLVGFSIIDSDKKVIGEVTDLIEAGPQVLLEGKTVEGKEFLIPYHEDLVKKINKRKKIILVELPEGLLDI